MDKNLKGQKFKKWIKIENWTKNEQKLDKIENWTKIG